MPEGHYYSTVRYGECRSGASNRFTFNLALNEQVYEVEFYGSDRGGSPERPARYGRDLTIKKSEGESNFALNTGILADNLIFRNLARKLNASLYFGE